MVNINRIGEAKNWIERPGDTLLRRRGTDLIRKANITTGRDAVDASLALAGTDLAASFFREGKIRYDQGLDLPTRGALMINFGGPFGPPDQDTAIIPFYENPEITEENSAHYTTRNIFGRNSPLRNYTHSGPRVFNIKVPYLLDHIRSFNYRAILDRLDMRDVIAPYVDYYEKEILENLNEKAVRLNNSFFNNFHRKFDNLVDRYARIDLSPEGIQEKYRELFGGDTGNSIYDILAAYFTILELVRSSVLTSVRNPWQKPPTVNLKLGAAWDNIQCICTSYTIDYDEDAGYDVHTLLPRRFIYTLRLEEYVPLPSQRERYENFYKLKGSDDIRDRVGSADRTKVVSKESNAFFEQKETRIF